MFFHIMDGVNAQHARRRRMTTTHPILQICLYAALAFAGTMAWANVIHVGGFAGNGVGERVEQVEPLALSAWREEFGTRLEITGTFVQTATGEGSVVVRLLDNNRPLIVAWHGATGFQLIAPGGLQQNTPAVSTPSGTQTVVWRLRIHALQRSAQRLVLETQDTGGLWHIKLENKMSLHAVREWVEAGAGVTVGIAGPVALEVLSVRFFREGTLLLVK